MIIFHHVLFLKKEIQVDLLKNKYTFSIKDNLFFNKNYKINLNTKIEDLNGNKLNSEYTSSTGFKTEDLIVDFDNVSILFATSSNGEIHHSLDGNSWSKINCCQNKNFTGNIESVVYGFNKFIAGSGYNILSSNDGFNWTVESSDYFRKLFFHNSLIFTLGSSLRYSNDLSNWTEVNLNYRYGRDIVYGNNKYIIVGDDGKIESSDNGSSWTVVNSNTTEDLEYIVFGNNLFIASGKKGIILTSSDGINWNKYSLKNKTSFGTSAFDWGGNLFFVNQYFYISGTLGAFIRSENGMEWSSLNRNSIYAVDDMKFIENYYFAADRGGNISISKDGVNWLNKNLSSRYLYKIGFKN